MLHNIIYRVAAGLIAGIALLYAFGCAGFAMFTALDPKYGEVQAALLVSAVYVVVAFAFGLFAALHSKVEIVQPVPASHVDEHHTALSWISAVAHQRPLMALGVAAGLGVIKALSRSRPHALS